MRLFAVWFALLLFTLTNAASCPDGYTQSNGGDCFKTSLWLVFSEDANNAEQLCDDGAMLASIHSKEDSDMVPTMHCSSTPPEAVFEKIIGLRCVGMDCKWDDGTEVDYTNFPPGYVRDDNIERCYAIEDDTGYWTETYERCGKQKGCWLCKLNAKIIDCLEGETEYKGGCISVHSTPANQTTADDSCPDGGHLLSVHGPEENRFYQRLASNSGLSGAFYLGGILSDGGSQWIDRTHFNFWTYADYFPNAIFGDCLQMMLSTEFGNQGQWTNVDCSTKLPYLCFRDGRMLPSTTTKQPTTVVTSPSPLASYKCPSVQVFNTTGRVYSPNYPFSIPGKQTCEYVLGTDRGTKASIKFPSYACQSGIKLTVFDGLDSTEPLLTFTSTPPNPYRLYMATSNVIKIVFETNNAVGNGWEAEFFGIKM